MDSIWLTHMWSIYQHRLAVMWKWGRCVDGVIYQQKFSQQYQLRTWLFFMYLTAMVSIKFCHQLCGRFWRLCHPWYHFTNTLLWHLIMGAMASQITSLTIVYSIVHSGADQRKHQSCAALAFVWGNHWWPVKSPHKWPVMRKMFAYDDVIMRNQLDQLPLCGMDNKTTATKTVGYNCPDSIRGLPRPPFKLGHWLRITSHGMICDVIKQPWANLR